MEAEKEYCDEDGQLDEEMIGEAWLAEDEKEEEFLQEEEEAKGERDDYSEDYYEQGPPWNDNCY
jgi:hypothetical protein